MRPTGAGETLPVRPARTEARRRLAARLARAGIDSAEIDARLLICAAAGIDHAGLVRDPDVVLDDRQAGSLAAMADRRIAGEPIARILGRREFWGLPFAISPAVLDPRPETEGVVASALDASGGRRSDRLSILDLGIGSGAILVALLHELPNAWGIGIDRSGPACAVARHNMAASGLADRGAVVCGDWASAVRARFDMVVSNPPYVKSADIDGLDREVREHDPRLALDGGVDGLDAYRRIAESLDCLLLPGGVAVLECGAGQGAAIAALVGNHRMRDCAVYRDLAGQDRVVLGFAGG